MIDQYKFCPKCGSRLEKKLLHFTELGFFDKIFVKVSGYKKFDSATGEENMITSNSCPKCYFSRLSFTYLQ